MVQGTNKIITYKPIINLLLIDTLNTINTTTPTTSNNNKETRSDSDKTFKLKCLETTQPNSTITK